MARPITFEIYIDDPRRAIPFYQEAFGWQFIQVEGIDFWTVTTGADEEYGINGVMSRRPKTFPTGEGVNAFVCTIGVPSVDEALAKVEEAGGTVFVEKFAVVGLGWQAYCRDTEGNIFGLLEFST